MDNEFISFTISKQKNIALIAHDSKKKEMIEWCSENKDILQRHFLCGTGTTARMIADKTGLPIFRIGWRPADWCEDCRGED